MTLILSQLIKKKVPDWNDRVFSIEDFYSLCETQRVTVIERRIRSKGEYLVYDGKAFIVLREQIVEPLKSWIAFHELGHHLLHYPLPHSFSKGTYRKMDREANYFAAVALIPSGIVRELSTSELAGEFDFAKGLLRIRLAIYRNMGI